MSTISAFPAGGWAASAARSRIGESGVAADRGDVDTLGGEPGIVEGRQRGDVATGGVPGEDEVGGGATARGDVGLDPADGVRDVGVLLVERHRRDEAIVDHRHADALARERDADVAVEPDDRLEEVLVLALPEAAMHEHHHRHPGGAARHVEIEHLARVVARRVGDVAVDVDDVLREVRVHRAVASGGEHGEEGELHHTNLAASSERSHTG